MAATVYDVAAKAGVSFQLVSAVLGNKKYAHASEATRKKIFEAARELGYRSNRVASTLAGGNSKIIGVIIDSRAADSHYRILAEIENEAGKYGYRLLIAQAHDDPEKLLDSYYSLKQNGVDGIISFAHDYSHLNCHLDEVLKDDPKIVFVLNSCEGRYSAVDVDIAAGIVAASEHLRSRGYHKTALVLCGADTLDALPQSCRKRINGFRTGCPGGDVFLLKSNGIDIPQLENECAQFIREKLIPGRFDSAIAVNDLLAVVLMNLLIAGGIRIPQQFGLVGCDNLPIGMCAQVKLTTLCYDQSKLADAVLKILLDKIAGQTGPVRKVFPMELVIRESTGKVRE